MALHHTVLCLREKHILGRPGLHVCTCIGICAQARKGGQICEHVKKEKFPKYSSKIASCIKFKLPTELIRGFFYSLTRICFVLLVHRFLNSIVAFKTPKLFRKTEGITSKFGFCPQHLSILYLLFFLPSSLCCTSSSRLQSPYLRNFILQLSTTFPAIELFLCLVSF